MRPRAVLAVLALLASPVALAQEPSPPAPAPDDADWSLGAGVTFFTTFSSSGSLGALGGLSGAEVPVPSASLERRLGERTWLVLGVLGAVTQDRLDPVEDGGFSYTRDDSSWLSLTAGVRRILTGPGAPVELSVLVLAEAGVADADLRYVSGGTEQRAQLSSWLAGGNAGIAVERVLTGGLSLRVATPLLGATWSSVEVEETGEPARDGSGLSVQALIAPRLELRLAF